jgi:hypothetical protein
MNNSFASKMKQTRHPTTTTTASFFHSLLQFSIAIYSRAKKSAYLSMYTFYVIPALMAVAAASTLPISTTAQAPGHASFYDPSVGLSTCGITPQSSDLVAGISSSYFTSPNPNKDPWCSKCVLVTGPKGSVTVRVVDKCVGCGPNDINLSTAAFSLIGDTNDGTIPIRWSEAPCA